MSNSNSDSQYFIVKNYKALNESKAKFDIKKQQQKNFRNHWEDIRINYPQRSGKLSAYFKYKNGPSILKNVL